MGKIMAEMLCADCSKELQAEEVYVCESCDQEQRNFIESVMGGDDEASNSV
ncbi:protein NinF [Serratia entomophila]